MYLSSVPRWLSRMSADIAVRYWLMYSRRVFGSSASEMVVKPRTSTNMTDSSRDSPSMLYLAGSSAISATSSGATYSPKRDTSALLFLTSKK